MKNTILIILLIFSFKSFSQNSTKIEKLSQTEIKTFILTETKQGGKLDFFTEIKGKEYNASQVKPGLFMTNIEMALYKWGKANFDLGIENIESALKIFEEFRGKELNIREKDLIPMGFRNDLIK
ncbi:hypothetical protein [Flavobacterium sp. SM2513]|uniref:hypothetical protein n=1 Tax=Flavobacterium sp. SM2513 TaxID=3424766 RepID=UPI003D7F4F38